MAFLALQQSDKGLGMLWVWLAIILLPMLGRIVGWVIARLSPKDGAKQSTSREERRERAREIQRRGEEMWKRLLEGTGEAPAEPAAPGPATPPPRAVRRPGPVVREELRGELREELRGEREPVRPVARKELPSRGATPTLERELVGASPSERMDETAALAGARPSAATAASASLAEPGGGEAFPDAGDLSSLGLERVVSDEASLRPSFRPPRDASEWRRAFLLSEVLGAPIALRGLSGATSQPPWDR